MSEYIDITVDLSTETAERIAWLGQCCNLSINQMASAILVLYMLQQSLIAPDPFTKIEITE